MQRTYEPMFAILDEGGNSPHRLHIARGDPNTTPWCRSTHLGATVMTPSRFLEPLSGALPKHARLQAVVRRRNGWDRDLYRGLYATLEQIFGDDPKFRNGFNRLLQSAANALVRSMDPQTKVPCEPPNYRGEHHLQWTLIRLDNTCVGTHVEPARLSMSDLSRLFGQQPYLGQSAVTSDSVQLNLNERRVSSICFGGYPYHEANELLETACTTIRAMLGNDQHNELLSAWFEIVSWYTGTLYKILARERTQSA